MNRSVIMFPGGMPEAAGQKYRPSNSVEGDIFFGHWCCKCARDKAMSEGLPIEECDDNQRCDIIARTFAHDIDEPEYPTEWKYDQHGQPCCSAFVPVGEAIPNPRCERTNELF